MSDGGNIKESSHEGSTHSEEQSRDGSAALYMNHGQQTWEVALSGSSKEQSARGTGTMEKKKKNG